MVCSATGVTKSEAEHEVLQAAKHLALQLASWVCEHEVQLALTQAL